MDTEFKGLSTPKKLRPYVLAYQRKNPWDVTYRLARVGETVANVLRYQALRHPSIDIAGYTRPHELPTFEFCGSDLEGMIDERTPTVVYLRTVRKRKDAHKEPFEDLVENAIVESDMMLQAFIDARVA